MAPTPEEDKERRREERLIAAILAAGSVAGDSGITGTRAVQVYRSTLKALREKGADAVA